MPRGGARNGAGRPTRAEPKQKPIWLGQMTDDERQRIIDALTPDERRNALLKAVEEKEMQPRFERKGEWSGYTVSTAATGYVVDYWSRVQGETDGLRLLVPYSETFPQAMDLDGMWNDATRNGEAVATLGQHNAKTLRKGHKVQ